MTSLSPDTQHYDETVLVLIVGGSLIGLSTAALLANYGVSSLVVERHPGTAIHPRLAMLSARTMEILRSAGVEPPFSRDSSVPVAASLVG